MNYPIHMGQPQRRIKFFATLMGSLMLLLGAVFAVGQGCSAMYSGNGGGYGGMQPPINEGTYDNTDRTTSSQSGSDPLLPGYFHFSQTPTCPTSTDFGGLGAFVDGNVYLSPTLSTWRYRTDLCATPVSISSGSISRVHFDPNVAIYNNVAHLYLNTPPTNSGDLKFSQAYCTQVDAPNIASVETGVSAFVYLQNGISNVVLYRGVQVGSQFFRYRLGPFAVNEETLSGRTHYTALGFDLNLAPSAPSIGAGHLNLLWDGSYLDLEMNCLQE